MVPSMLAASRISRHGWNVSAEMLKHESCEEVPVRLADVHPYDGSVHHNDTQFEVVARAVTQPLHAPPFCAPDTVALLVRDVQIARALTAAWGTSRTCKLSLILIA
jgi:hypothetical protein